MSDETTLLIVDDEPITRDTLEALLYKEGYNLIFAENGREALEKAAEFLPDMVLLDVMMPGMDGFEVCRMLRADKILSELPIIMITALDDSESRLTGIVAGADDFISKPYDKNELRARIRAIARLNRYRSLLTEKEKAIKVLNESERLYRMLTESMTDGALLIQNQKIVFANNAVIKIFQYPEGEDLSGMTASDLFQGKFESFFEKVFSQNFHKKGVEPVFRGNCYTRENAEIWILANISYLTWKTIPAVFITLKDVTKDVLRQTEIHKQSEVVTKAYVKLKSSQDKDSHFGDIIGKSCVMQKVYESILWAAGTTATVSITGESGTGKELVAKAIHDMSERAKKKFVTVNCGAIPENLAESEFFGHKKGSFTGAHKDKKGYFSIADKGTLFLDEIGELPLNIQVKLLRAIESGGYTPVGDTVYQTADVRIISATNRDLFLMMKKGSVRDDFYYRVNVLPIELPALQDRKEDIELLFQHFLNNYSEKEKQMTVPVKTMDRLKNYPWPGNVRELQSVVRRYLASGSVDFLNSKIIMDKDQQFTSPELSPETEGLRETLEAFEENYLKDVLNQNLWHRGKTAAALKIGQRTLYTKMQKFGLL